MERGLTGSGAPARAAATAERSAVPTLVPEIQTISFTEMPEGRFSSGTAGNRRSRVADETIASSGCPALRRPPSLRGLSRVVRFETSKDR